MSKMINALGQVTEGNEESLDAVVGVGRRIPRLRTTRTIPVQIRISDRQGGQPNVTIFDGNMSEEQITRLDQSLRQNATRSPDHRLVQVEVHARRRSWTYKVTPTFAVNLRRLYGYSRLQGTPEAEEPKEIIAE